MVNRLVKILIALFLFFPFIFPQNTFAAVTVQITSVSPQNPGLGAKVKFSAEVTGLTGYNYFLAKVDMGKTPDQWYKGIIPIYDPATAAYKSCGYTKRWEQDCAKFTVYSDIWSGEIEAQIPSDFPIGDSIFRVRVRRAGEEPFGTSNTVSVTVVLPVSENLPGNTTPQNPLPCPSGIYLSEFMANPESGNEWVEIKNSSGSTITLTDWKIDDADEDSRSSQSFSVQDFGNGSYHVIDVETAIFDNSNADSVQLFCQGGGLVEATDYVKVRKGYSFAKDESGNWQETITPTKERENEITPPEIKEEKKAEFTKTSENEVFAQTQSAGSSAALGESSENTETEGDILPDSASDFRPEKPPVWGVKGEVEATASQKIEEASSEASRSAGKDFSKKMIGGGALLSLGSLFYIVLTKFKGK